MPNGPDDYQPDCGGDLPFMRLFLNSELTLFEDIFREGGKGVDSIMMVLVLQFPPSTAVQRD